MIIGLAGPKGSGKDFCADMLADIADGDYMTTEHLHFGKFERYAMAEPLKDFVMDILNMDFRHSSGYLKETVVRCVIPTHEHVKASCIQHFGTVGPAGQISSRLVSWRMAAGLIDISYRQAMQFIGTDIIRNNYGTGFWTDLAKKQTGNLIISDIRFEDEAGWVRENGYLIHVDAPGIEFTNEHASEAGIKRRRGDLVWVNKHEGHMQARAHAKGIYSLIKRLTKEEMKL